MINPDSVLAKAFAFSGCFEQAELLNMIGRELFVACKGHTGFEDQCCAISQRLNQDAYGLIDQLHGFIELRRQEVK